MDAELAAADAAVTKTTPGVTMTGLEYGGLTPFSRVRLDAPCPDEWPVMPGHTKRRQAVALHI